MREVLERFSHRHEYRLASALLLIGIVVSASFFLWTGRTLSSGALAFVIGSACYVALVVLTYHRLQDAAFSGWWILPMVLVFHIGPTWELGSWEWGSYTFRSSFNPSGLIALVPVMIGWFARARDQGTPSV